MPKINKKKPALSWFFISKFLNYFAFLAAGFLASAFLAAGFLASAFLVSVIGVTSIGSFTFYEVTLLSSTFSSFIIGLSTRST